MSQPQAPSPRLGSVEFWAKHAPDAQALCESARSLTWAQWNAQANRLADVLHVRAGIGPGDHVAVCMQNRLEWFVTQAATAKLGAVLVPIAWRLTPAEVHYIVADCAARAFAFDSEDVEAMSRVWTNAPRCDKDSALRLALSVMHSPRADVVPFAQAAQDGPLVERWAARGPRSIVYTSGTTGRPRGVVHALPKAAPSGRAQTSATGAGPSTSQPAMAPTRSAQRNLLGAPLNHAAGQASARATLAAGGCVYIMPRFDALEALRLIDRERITTTFLVPTMLQRIMSLPPEVLAAHDVSSVQQIFTGASPCPVQVKQQVIAHFGPHCLTESYGSTEVGIVARMQPQDQLRKLGSCGRVLDGVVVKIVDGEGRELPRGEVGEILVETPVMIERYLNEPPPKELVDGLFATGDVGKLDDEGFLYVLDRKKDMIIAGGVNIYPAEIESALREHPAVFDAVVFGVPHPELGEQVHAVVERAPGASVSEQELSAFVEDKLARYKRPRAYEFVTELPRNATGKPLKAQLRARHWEGTGKVI